MRNVRTAVSKLLESYDDTLTFADMRKVVNSQEETLLGLDRFFALDLQFLNEHAQPLAEQTVRAQLIKSLPSHDNFESFAISKSIEDIDKCKSQMVVGCCGVVLIKDIGTVQQLMQNLKDGRPPSDQSVVRMSPFFRQILSRCEHFVFASTPAKDNKNFFAVPKLISGKEALAVLWASLEAKPPQDRTLQDVEQFRRFAWLLDSEKQKIVNDIVAQGVRNYQQSMALGMAICDKGASSAGACDAKGSGSSSSSSSSSGQSNALAKQFLAAAKPLGKGSKEDTQADSIAAQKLKLLAMFKK
jgi:hypothetical protein